MISDDFGQAAPNCKHSETPPPLLTASHHIHAYDTTPSPHDMRSEHNKILLVDDIIVDGSMVVTKEDDDTECDVVVRVAK